MAHHVLRWSSRWIPEDQPAPAPDPSLARFSVCPDNLLNDPEPESVDDSGTPLETPEHYVERYWEEVPLPTPQPYIAPGRAITGMFAYLETRGTTSHTYSEPQYALRAADGRRDRAGTTSTGATGRGLGPIPLRAGRGPTGEIKHEYIHVGTYDVVVTERWSATWSFGGRSGTLDRAADSRADRGLSRPADPGGRAAVGGLWQEMSAWRTFLTMERVAPTDAWGLWRGAERLAQGTRPRPAGYGDWRAPMVSFHTGS